MTHLCNCPECGQEIEVRKEKGKFIAGCWSDLHNPPTIDGIEYEEGEIWPICGLPKETEQDEQDAIESFKAFWL